MRLICPSTICILAAISLGFSDVTAFLPFGGQRVISSISKTENHHFAFRKVTRLNAEEFASTTSAAQAAFISSAPLLLAPLAALALGSQALSNKEKLVLDLYATEIELDDIKQKVKNSQLQATSSFALALASAGLVAANTFGNIAPTQQKTSGNLFSDTMAKTEVLSPSQQTSTSSLLEKMEAGISAESALDIPPPPAITSEEEKQSEPQKDEPKVESTAEGTASAPASDVVDSAPAEVAKEDPQQETPPPQIPEPMIATPDFKSNVDTSTAQSQTVEEPPKSEVETKSQADGLMSKLDAAMKEYKTSKSETQESPLAESPTVSTAESSAEESPAIEEPAQEVPMPQNVESITAIPEQTNDIDASVAQSQIVEKPSKPEADTKSQADDLMSKLDAAMKEYTASKPETQESTVTESPTLSTAESSVDETLAKAVETKLDITVESKQEEVPAPTTEQPEPQADTMMSKLEAVVKSFMPSKPATDEISDESPLAESTTLSTAESTSAETPTEAESTSSEVLAESKMDEPKSETSSGQTDSGVDTLMSKLDEAMSKYTKAGSEVVEEVTDGVNEAIEKVTAEPNVGTTSEEQAVNEQVESSTAESTEQASPFDGIMAKLEAAMKDKEASSAAPSSADVSKVESPTMDSATIDNLPTEETSTDNSVIAPGEAFSEPAGTKDESSQAQPSADTTASVPETGGTEGESSLGTSGIGKSEENMQPQAEQSSPSTDISASVPEKAASPAAPDADVSAIEKEEEGQPPVVSSDIGAVESKKNDAPTLKEDDVFPTNDEDVVAGTTPLAEEDQSVSEIPSDSVISESPAEKEESVEPILAVPAIQTPAPTSSLPEIRIPGLENMDPAVYQTAAAIAAGAVLVGILASVGDDTATMPVGKKEEKSSYLEGLTRSSTSTGSKPAAPSSYLETLKASETQVKPATPASTSAPGTGSYLENLSGSKQTTSSAGYGLPKTKATANDGAKVSTSSTPPVTKPPPAVVTASQSNTVSRPPEDPRASIPKSRFSPPTEKPRPANQQQVSRQRVPEPPKAVPGLSYLESMAVGGPQKIPPPIKRNSIGDVGSASSPIPPPAKRNNIGDVSTESTPKAVPGLSYLERMAQDKTTGSIPPNGAGSQPNWNGSSPQSRSFSNTNGQGTAPPNGVYPAQSSPPPYQSFSDSLSRQNGQATKQPPAPSPPFQSFSDSLSQPNGEAPAPPTKNDKMTQTNVGSKADRPKPKAPAGFGSYLDSL